jgi:hypothetical protein
MKVLKVTLAVTLAVGLILGATLPGLANSDEPAPQVESQLQPRILKGQVSGIDETEEIFTIQAGEQSIDIKVNEGTRYFELTAPLQGLAALRQHRMESFGTQGRIRATASDIPMKFKAAGQMLSLRRGKPFTNLTPVPAETQEFAPNLPAPGWGKENPKRLQGNLEWMHQFGGEATFDDITVGNRVIVLVAPNEGEPLAKLVLIIEPAACSRVIGEVTEITGDTVTITPENGNAVELNYNEDTIFILRGTPSLEEGEEAVVIYVETDDGLLAKRIRQGGRLSELVD